jgi:hypothetical protein
MEDKNTTRFDLRQIIRALDWWNEGGWKTSNAVGAIIQQKAQKLLDTHADMSALKTEAESQLKLLNTEADTDKKLQSQLAQGSFNMMPGTVMFPFSAMQFPTFTLSKTRREVLEEMHYDQIEGIFKMKQREEIKADRIRYILEQEKGDK